MVFPIMFCIIVSEPINFLYQLSIYVLLWHIVQYMYIVIFKGDFHDRYINSAISLPVVNKILLSMMSKLIEAFVQIFSSAVNHLYNLTHF